MSAGDEADRRLAAKIADAAIDKLREVEDRPGTHPFVKRHIRECRELITNDALAIIAVDTLEENTKGPGNG